MVSVVVITYNSSKYVLDTLESVKAQDYANIELIVSDDCSTDGTFELCRKWVDENAGRFVRTAVVRTPRNGGICANYNRGLREVRGEWVKYIAGDDMLVPSCISEFVTASVKTCDKILVCGTLHFRDGEETEEPRMLPAVFGGGMDTARQRAYIVEHGTVIEGPALFLETATLRSMGGFEEKYPFIEDYPLCMKYLLNDLHIGLVEKHLVRYRVYGGSVSHGSPLFAASIFAAIDFYAPRAARMNGMWKWWWHYRTDAVIRKMPPGILRSAAGYAMRLFDLVQWRKKLRKGE